MIKLVKTLSAAAVLSGFAMSAAVADNSGHSNIVTCFAAVQTECYGNGEENCTSEEYNQGLDWCEESYPSQNASRPINNLRTPTNNAKKLKMQR